MYMRVCHKYIYYFKNSMWKKCNKLLLHLIMITTSKLKNNNVI